jgi:filamentous hemagglutinin family protein
VVGTWLACYPSLTLAQIAGDGTLGTQVNGAAIAPCTGVCTISNGTTRRGNLFHSFGQFSLPNATDQANFQTTPAIQNVIVRVTGVGQPFISNLNGTIATSNPANFFLLNPNGIIFGSGASLNIGGSFLATTANRMQFADGTVLRANDPAPLLTISVPIGLQFNQTPASIQAQGTRLLADSGDFFADFALVGGNVTFNNSIIQAPGRRIEVSAVGENSTVKFELTGDRLSLSRVAATPRRDITLIDGSRLDARSGSGGGDVMMTGQNITLSSGFILAGILAEIDNSATNQAGDITINAANLQLNQRGTIANSVSQGAIGQGGNIIITASGVEALGGSAIQTITSGNGNAGNIRVEAGSLNVTDGSQILSATVSTGDAGNVRVTANTISLAGSTPDGRNRSRIASEVLNTGSGRAGDVTVETGFLSATNGARVSATTFGRGNGGNVHVSANTIVIDGRAPGGGSPSGIGSQVAPQGLGQGGDVTIATGSLTATNGAVITANTFGQGDAGKVSVMASTIVLDGTDPASGGPSAISNEVSGAGRGRGGELTVKTGSLRITNGARVSAATFGQGDAGKVQVTANTIFLSGTGSNGENPSVIGSEVGSTGSGRGGDITIEAGTLTITNNAAVSASTFGNGNGGNVRVTANTISLDDIAPNGQLGSGIASQAGFTGRGNGGDVSIKTEALTVRDGAAVSASNFGSGSAGNLDIIAQTMHLDLGEISASAVSGNGANINLNVGDLLLLRHNSQISTSAGLAGAGGNGGNINITTPRGFLVTVPNENNDITANAFNGSGGRVTINAQSIYGFIPRSRDELVQLLGPNQLDPRLLPTNDITASSQFGLSGSVTVNTPDLDPNRGLVQLPTTPTDPSNRIDQSCASSSSGVGSRFTVTGRGGLPSQPDESLSPSDTLPRLATLPPAAGQPAPPIVRVDPTPPIAEAQAALRLPNGKIRFVAQTTTPIPIASQATTVSCASWPPVAQGEVKR